MLVNLGFFVAFNRFNLRCYLITLPGCTVLLSSLYGDDDTADCLLFSWLQLKSQSRRSRARNTFGQKNLEGIFWKTRARRGCRRKLLVISLSMKQSHWRNPHLRIITEGLRQISLEDGDLLCRSLRVGDMTRMINKV